MEPITAINFKLTEMATFVAVAELQSFRAAADRLNVAQSTVSVRIRHLEEALGITLLQRSTRHVVLTSGGTRLLAAARVTLGELEQLATQLRDEGLLREGRVTAAALPSIAATVIPALLLRFGERHPSIEVSVADMVADRCEALLLAGDADLALSSPPQPNRGLKFRPLFRDECLVVVPLDDTLAARSSLRLEELTERPVLAPIRGSGFRADIDAAFAANGLTLNPAREAHNLSTLMAYAENGVGVSFVPATFAKKLDLARCRTVRIAPKPYFRTLGIVTRVNRPISPAAEAFIRFVEARLAAPAQETDR
ncbi:hypothetical protein DLJ53_21630 [Acuticoccus sediminis]|uniref:HTH lysR-type domain-containing protein n=1 Tax=Acuticoccus sediminis TaxID=2184697 RepID=A0A8B2NPN7_9HYPH|nr:LysR family transcriptional regulator [Acuticoccus sediminis]RAH99152.1 hypothetical protein DLJ53_21630 [Acuticoccus sediminis]